MSCSPCPGQDLSRPLVLQREKGQRISKQIQIWLIRYRSKPLTVAIAAPTSHITQRIKLPTPSTLRRVYEVPGTMSFDLRAFTAAATGIQRIVKAAVTRSSATIGSKPVYQKLVYFIKPRRKLLHTIIMELGSGVVYSPACQAKLNNRRRPLEMESVSKLAYSINLYLI